MKRIHVALAALIAGLALSTLTFDAAAQTADALLNKLVEKGVLSKQEADELKKETDTGFDKAYRTRTGLPDWVTSLRIYGDVRVREEGLWTDNDSGTGPGAVDHDRWRMRYRLRVGTTVTMKEAFELGFRFTSGEPSGGFGGDPISNNTTMQDNGSKKFLYIDTAYGKWTPIKSDPWTLSGTFGKIESPFVVSPMLLDDDYTPEGAAITAAYAISKENALKFSAGFFYLDEIAQGEDYNNDSFLIGAQTRWDNKLTPWLDLSAGAGFFIITDEQTLTNFAVPNVNVGNTRATNGALLHDYTALIVDAAATGWLDSAPLYAGKFPIRLAGSFIYNPGAPDDNHGIEGGISLGKAGKKRTWEVSHRYRYMERDAWYEELTESDFAAYYQVSPANSGIGAGYRAGTGLQGHIFRVSYSPADSVTLSITYYLTEVIDPERVGGERTESDTSRLQFDAIWRF